MPPNLQMSQHRALRGHMLTVTNTYTLRIAGDGDLTEFNRLLRLLISAKDEFERTAPPPSSASQEADREPALTLLDVAAPKPA